MKKFVRKKRFKLYLFIATSLFMTGMAFFGLYHYVYKADDIPPSNIEKNIFTKRYVLWRGWVSRDINRGQLLAVMQQAKDAGYNGIVVNDYDAVFKWGNDSGTPTQIANRKEVTDKAAELGLVLIPTHNIMNGMYEGTTTSLAEALPVQDTEFNVQSGVATAQMDPAISLSNPGFENWEVNPSDKPTNLTVDQPSMPGQVAFRDDTVKHGGNSSLRFEDTKNNPTGNATTPTFGHGRVMENDDSLITVPQYRTYEASVWLRTENLNQPGSMNFSVTGYDADGNSTKSRVLYSNSSAKMGVSTSGTAVGPNQEWTQYKVVFNSLDKTKIRLYLGSWPSEPTTATGKFWFDDLAIKEVGLDNVVRRDSLPLTVKSDDDATTYIEGQDYVVGKQQLTIPSGSSIQEGQNLKVSWYQYANMISNTPMENVCHQEYWDKLNTDIGHLNTIYPDAYGYFIGYDEWRTANWDPACIAINHGKKMTGGEYFAYAMQQTENIYKNIKPGTELYVWNDMFDPYHNAVPIYYDVNGPVNNVIQNGTETNKGSWAGLSPNTTVINWNAQTDDIVSQTQMSKEKSSLKFFADHGHRQIFSISGLDSAQKFMTSLNELEADSGGINGIEGFMYTSWATNPDGTVGDYTDLEATAQILKDAGRFGTNSLITTPNKPAVSIPPFTYKDKIIVRGTKDDGATQILINNSSNGVIIDGNNWSKEVTLPVGVKSVFSVVAKLSNSETSNSVELAITRHKMADANNDGNIDKYDFGILMSEWSKQETNNIANFNEDTEVGSIDFSMMMSNWTG